MKEDPNFRFGKPAYIPGNQRVAPVIRNEYLREFLQKNITSQAQNNVEIEKI